MIPRKTKTLAAVVGAIVLALLLSGCNGFATTSDMGAIVVGDGKDGNNAKVQEIVYPGEVSKKDNSGRVAYYVPMGVRNYVIGNDSPDKVDRTTPAVGFTKSGTPVNVYLSSQWTVNQTKSILENKFWPFCLKSKCASTNPDERGPHSSTPGWNSMLAENYGPAVNDAVRNVMPQFDDAVWQKRTGWAEVEKAIATDFRKQLRKRTTYTDDLFCGSGDLSQWKGGRQDDGTPGTSYTCGPITFDITSIAASNPQQQAALTDAAAAEQQRTSNAKILAASVAKYGSAQVAGSALAQIDIIAACKAAGISCTVIVGGNGMTTVSAPVAQPSK